MKITVGSYHGTNSLRCYAQRRPTLDASHLLIGPNPISIRVARTLAGKYSSFRDLVAEAKWYELTLQKFPR